MPTSNGTLLDARSYVAWAKYRAAQSSRYAIRFISAPCQCPHRALVVGGQPVDFVRTEPCGQRRGVHVFERVDAAARRRAPQIRVEALIRGADVLVLPGEAVVDDE